jgi:alginate O-acetyltransferase complex protein AlgJ
MRNGTTSIHRVQVASVAIVFTLLWLPLADNLLHLDRSRPSNENRTLSPAPRLELTEQALKEFPRSFEAFYDDQFGFRNFLVRQFHTVNFGWLGIADPEQVVKGKEGWLYLGRKALIDESRGLSPLQEKETQAWAAKIDAIQQWQEARGGTFLFVLVPDKQRVFPEFLPDWYTASESRRKEQLLEVLAPLGTPVLDLTETLREAKERGGDPVWLKTDTHWNGVGAWHGYRAIMERLSPSLPTLKPMEESVLLRSLEPGLGAEAWRSTGDLAGLLGVRDLAPESWLGLLPAEPRARSTQSFPAPTRKVGGVNVPYATEIDDPALPTTLVIGGSFRWALVPLLSEHFRRVLYTDFRYCFFDLALAEAEQPDLILFVLTEQQLVWFPEPPGETTW